MHSVSTAELKQACCMRNMLRVLEPQDLTQLLQEAEKSLSEEMIVAYAEAQGWWSYVHTYCSTVRYRLFDFMQDVKLLFFIEKQKLSNQ